MTTLAERLRALLDAKGWKNVDLQRKAKLKSASTITELLKGVTVHSPQIPNIADALGVSAFWLKTGRGEKYPSTEPNAWEKLQANALENKPAKDDATFTVLDVRAACGDGYVNHDYPEVVRTIVMSPEEAISRIGDVNKSGSIKVVIAHSDSMSPTIEPDDLLFVDTAIAEYTGEGIYIIRNHGELLCKRMSRSGRELTVSSDNACAGKWPWRNRAEDFSVIGKVICALPIRIRKF